MIWYALSVISQQDFANWVAQNFSRQNILLNKDTLAGVSITVAYKRKFNILFLSQLKILSLIGYFDNLTYEYAVNFTQAASEYSKSHTPGLPTGLQSGAFCFPVMVAQHIDTAVVEYVAKQPKKKWSALTMPVIYNLSNGSIYYYQETPLWGAAFYPTLHKYIEDNFHFRG
jgi:hypothetical protein